MITFTKASILIRLGYTGKWFWSLDCGSGDQIRATGAGFSLQVSRMDSGFGKQFFALQRLSYSDVLFFAQKSVLKD